MTDLLVDTLHVTSVESGSVAAHFKHKILWRNLSQRRQRAWHGHYLENMWFNQTLLLHSPTQYSASGVVRQTQHHQPAETTFVAEIRNGFAAALRPFPGIKRTLWNPSLFAGIWKYSLKLLGAQRKWNVCTEKNEFSLRRLSKHELSRDVVSLYEVNENGW